MLHPCQTISENTRKLEKIEKERYEKQKAFQEMYDSYTVEAKDRIKTEETAIMEENIRIEIRNWINNYYQQTGKIPELPSAESGGSRVIFSRQVTSSFIDNNVTSALYAIKFLLTGVDA